MGLTLGPAARRRGRRGGISRGLLLHYFPTRSDYFDAVVGAALRRVLRNVSPDPDDGALPAVHAWVAYVEDRALPALLDA